MDEGTTAPEPKRDRVVATFNVHVTLRSPLDHPEIPTNAELAEALRLNGLTGWDATVRAERTDR